MRGLAAVLACAAAFDLEILHMNDHHSHLEPDDFEYYFAEANVTMDIEYGGFPMVVSLYEELAAGKTNVLKLHAGDAITGTSYYAMFGYEADAEMMNQVCFDAFVVGNHEFDDGDANLAGFVDALKNESSPCEPTVAVLGANVVPGSTSPLQGKLDASATFQVDGETIGVVGIDIRQKTLASSRPDAGTTLLDEVETAQAEVEALTAAGVDKIILLTHVGYSMDVSSLAANVSGVDVVVGGDSHSLLGDGPTLAGGTPLGPYPTMVTNADGDPACVVQAWQYALVVGQLNVTFDDDGVVTACSGEAKLPFDVTSLDDAFVADLVNASNGQLVGVVPDADTAALLEGYQAQVAELETTVIADVPENICFERFPGQGRSVVCDVAESYNMGGAACNVVAQAFLYVTLTADVALQNAGGCRTDIDAGNFTIDDAYTLLPFSNTLVTVEATGAEIKSLLEEGLTNSLDDGGSSGSYPYAAGLRYDVDTSMASGERISNIEVNSRLEAGEWTPVDMTQTYTLVTNDFIADGRDGYVTFLDLDVVDTYIEYAQSFIDYAVAQGTLENPPYSTFSTQRYSSADCDHSITTTDCVTLDCDTAANTCADDLQNGYCACDTARRSLRTRDLKFGFYTPSCDQGYCAVAFDS